MNAVSPNLLGQGSSNFHMAFLFLPKSKRQAMFDFYEFCRYADDIVDELARKSPVQAQSALANLREDVEAASLGQAISPLGKKLNALFKNFSISKQHLMDVIDGCEMDLNDKVYKTFEDLYQYCYQVASAVGLVSIEIFGYSSPTTPNYAIDLGLAFQLTNILRDLKEDALRGRIYLPQEDLERFGYTLDMLNNFKVNPAFYQLMQFECDRAMGFYHSAAKNLCHEDCQNMLAAQMMCAVYLKILQKIEKDPKQVFQKKVKISKIQKTFLAFTTYFKIRS